MRARGVVDGLRTEPSAQPRSLPPRFFSNARMPRER